MIQLDQNVFFIQAPLKVLHCPHITQLKIGTDINTALSSFAQHLFHPVALVDHRAGLQRLISFPSGSGLAAAQRGRLSALNDCLRPLRIHRYRFGQRLRRLLRPCVNRLCLIQTWFRPVRQLGSFGRLILFSAGKQPDQR